MPIYEYECNECEKKLEVVQKFSDPLLTECPECKGQLKKLISNTSFVLKGDGWYVTDYPSKDRKKEMETEKKSTSPATKSEKEESSKTGNTEKREPKKATSSKE